MAAPRVVTDLEEALKTTRAVRRRLDLDRPVEVEVLDECLTLALQAPTGGNRQDWRFLVIRDPDVRAKVAAVYERAYDEHVGAAIARGRDDPEVRGRLGADDTPEQARRMERILTGAEHLARNLHRVPVLVIACATRPNPEHGGGGTVSAVYGSIYPSVWSLQLALRSRGLGSIITTLHLHEAEEIAALLGIPEDVTQVCLLPVAYTHGTTFRPADRQPTSEVVFADHWGEPWPGTG
jgi:nitroreductase